jgi:hypothetical protein
MKIDKIFIWRKEKNCILLPIKGLFVNKQNMLVECLKELEIKNVFYLGKGEEGSVYHDEEYVYKVFYKLINVQFLDLLIDKNSKYFVNSFEVLEVAEKTVLKYEYFKNYSTVNSLSKKEVIEFAIECWKNKVVCKNIKLDNFIRVENRLIFIDYGVDVVHYSDNLFLNMCARLYIEVKYQDLEESQKKILKKLSINNFEIKELIGIHDFINAIFSQLIYSYIDKKQLDDSLEYLTVSNNKALVENIISSSLNSFLFQNYKGLNFSNLYYKLLKKGIRISNIDYFNIEMQGENIVYPTPKFYSLNIARNSLKNYDVSLVIKTCIQESKTIYQQIKHIIHQLSSPNNFKERIVLVDVKQEDFLRQYTTNNSYTELYKFLNILYEEGFIDTIIEIPKDKVLETNHEWFNIDVNETHTCKNAPVTSQLYLFDKIDSKYILQLDSDVLIGRKDFNHSFLDDMIGELEKNNNVISVGFNIPKRSNDFNNYFGFKDGGFVPEVRFSLIDKGRLLLLRPLPNELVDGKLNLTWHRSLHKKQKELGVTSVRGGDPRSYFIHPQNFRKECNDVWFTILDRIEQGYLLEKQKEEYELIGSYYDWMISKRDEEIVIVTLIRNMSYEGFLRCWESISSQDYQKFGWIIIDDESDNGLDIFIEHLVKNSKIKNNITYIKNRFRQGGMANTYKAIHYFCSNPNSIICMVDGDDALIGKDVFSNLKKYYENGADVVIGKMYRTDKLYPQYRYPLNFENTRLRGGNVWQHLKTFRKYLFDSIKLWDFKINTKNKLLGEKKEWIEYAEDYAFMVPIVEMSVAPKYYTIYNYFHQRRLPSTPEMKNIKEDYIGKILTKNRYTPNNVIKNSRRVFLPNFNKIEIDILYACNLKCDSCNRSSAQVNSQDYISLEQIESFITESIETNKKWDLINILGGEPTLHPNFLEIVNKILFDYIKIFSKNTMLQITSNGYGELTKKRLSQLPKHKQVYIDKNSFKTSSKVDYFTPFNNAPLDQEKYSDVNNFSDGCWVASYCGVSLNLNGYYPCSIIGATDRLIDGNKGKKSLTDMDEESQKKLMNEYCRYCGNYSDYESNFGDFIPRCEKAYHKKNIVTKSWNEIYRR